MRRMTMTALIVAVCLAIGKLTVSVLTGSVAVLASAIDSGMDAVASSINLLAVRHALEPADAEHRFGHGKAEALAALFQSMLILGSAALIVSQAVSRFEQAAPMDFGGVAIGVMVVSIIVTFMLVVSQRRVAKMSGSLAIEADSVHYASDVAQNLGVILAIVLSSFGGLGWADPVIGLIIAGLMVWGVWGIMSRAYADLMDRELPDEERNQIKQIVCAHPAVHSFHELRTRRSGVRAFIQFHIELDGSMTLEEAHEISEELEYRIADVFPNAEILIHQDPLGHEEEQRRF